MLMDVKCFLLMLIKFESASSNFNSFSLIWIGFLLFLIVFGSLPQKKFLLPEAFSRAGGRAVGFFVW
jgi:hypothetical protein